jgi:hypothetical protein
VAAEHFAIAADAHLWLGSLDAAEYTCPTPDGGPTTREGAAARLARVVCGDLEMLAEEDVTAIARRAADGQVEAVAAALGRVAARLEPELPPDDGARVHVFLAGSGAWLGEAAARRRGLPVEALGVRLGRIARVLPAYAVASLDAGALEGPGPRGEESGRSLKRALSDAVTT